MLVAERHRAFATICLLPPLAALADGFLADGQRAAAVVVVQWSTIRNWMLLCC